MAGLFGVVEGNAVQGRPASRLTAAKVSPAVPCEPACDDVIYGQQ